MNEGSKIDGITAKFGLQQITNESTYITGDSSSCVDLIFTSQPDLVMESGVHSSLNPNCHHQITYAKFNLKIHDLPPYVMLCYVMLCFVMLCYVMLCSLYLKSTHKNSL